MNQQCKRRTGRELFHFDEPDDAFELLETERGEPRFFGGREKESREELEKEIPIFPKLDENERLLRAYFRVDICNDLILRRFRTAGGHELLLAFIDGMANGTKIADFILRPCMRMAQISAPTCDELIKNVLLIQEIVKERNLKKACAAVLNGEAVLFVEGQKEVVVMDTRGYDSRQVGTPQNEKTIMGPHQGFTENLRTNITLVRRIVRTEDFVAEQRNAGGKNRVQLAILYRDGVANDSLVNEVKRRLAKVDTLTVMSSGTLEQLTEERTFAPLPQVLATERPDRVAGLIMRGHVAVVLDGSPMANVMPATLFTIMAGAEDSYLRQPMGTIIRIVRYIGATLSIFMPAYFLALALHHQGMLSGEILATVITSRSMVFLPLTFEMVFLLLIFQLVREAGLAVPGAMGQSIGIIGGLLLGQAAVTANIVSTVVLIIVALTGLGNFAIPDYSTQIAATYYRLLLIFAAWLGGLLGLFCALLLSVAYVASLKSYGVPFLSPVSPKTNAHGPVIVRGRIKKQPPEDYVNVGTAQ